MSLVEHVIVVLSDSGEDENIRKQIVYLLKIGYWLIFNKNWSIETLTMLLLLTHLKSLSYTVADTTLAIDVDVTVGACHCCFI